MKRKCQGRVFQEGRRACAYVLRPEGSGKTRESGAQRIKRSILREEGGEIGRSQCYVDLIGSVDFIMSLRSHLLGVLSGFVKISLCFFARKEFTFHGELIENVLRGVVVKSPIFFNCTIQRQICNRQIASMGVYRCTHNI